MGRRRRAGHRAARPRRRRVHSVGAAVGLGLAINWNPVTETWKNLKIAKANRTVFLSLLGISWLWFFGATFLTSRS